MPIAFRLLLSNIYRASTILILSLLGCSALANQPVETTSPILIENIDKPGAFKVTNIGMSSISLLNEILIQKKTNGIWDSSTLPLTFIENCNQPKNVKCITLNHNESILPVAWTGYSCNVQCGASCRGNVKFEAGQFRIVIKACDSSLVYYGPAFTIVGDKFK